jgi:hypothetical protein
LWNTKRISLQMKWVAKKIQAMQAIYEIMERCSLNESDRLGEELCWKQGNDFYIALSLVPQLKGWKNGSSSLQVLVKCNNYPLLTHCYFWKTVLEWTTIESVQKRFAIFLNLTFQLHFYIRCLYLHTIHLARYGAMYNCTKLFLTRFWTFWSLPWTTMLWEQLLWCGALERHLQITCNVVDQILCICSMDEKTTSSWCFLMSMANALCSGTKEQL